MKGKRYTTEQKILILCEDERSDTAVILFVAGVSVLLRRRRGEPR